MISIGERVKRAIDEMNRCEFLFALEQAAIAIDITARKLYQAPASQAGNYKKLLKEYSWLIELMSFPGIDLEKSKFGNFSFKDSKGKVYSEPTFQEIMYHIVRCSLVHGDTPEQAIKLQHADNIILGKNVLILPARLIWGLLSVVVFCKANKGESTAYSYYLTIGNEIFTINAWWGMEELVRAMNQEKTKLTPRVALNIPHGHFNPNNTNENKETKT